VENWHNNLISADDQRVRELLLNSKTIAVVGMKAETYKPSYYVPSYMEAQGYTIIPVNPLLTQIEQRQCYPDLKSLPQPVDIVQVFRRSVDVLPHAKETLTIPLPQAFWMQSGIINIEAANLLAQAGVLVVMDRCMYVDHRHLLGTPPTNN
jgi:uncharacterized protein